MMCGESQKLLCDRTRLNEPTEVENRRRRSKVELVGENQPKCVEEGMEQSVSPRTSVPRMVPTSSIIDQSETKLRLSILV